MQATGRDLPLSLIGMLFGVLQILFAVLGYDWLKTMSRFVLPLKLCAILYLAGLLATHPGRNSARWRYGITRAASRGRGDHRGVVQYKLFVMAEHDYRCGRFLPVFAQPARDLLGVGLASVCGTLVAAVFGAYAAACVLGTSGNVFTILSSTYPQAGCWW
ncbi:hypothetical protein RAA17_15000 [Komagataeibacter rhaeticus]|nr:hypothetical protein [Komagataeibacter rhaeticus]